MSSFSDLGVPARLDDVLAGLGLTIPTPIQAATLPDSLAGRDVLGRGRTGSGKTLAFLLPLVARLSASRRRPRASAPRALILAPTRELAGQIDAALAPLAAAAGLSSCTVFGGVGQNPQVTALRRGVDVVVACPGRLEDLIGQGHCSLAEVEVTVLDEADHMADLGFLPGVRRLLSQTPRGSQRLLFSATLDRAVDALVRQFLLDPKTHEADSAQSPVATMTHHVLQISRDNRVPVLVDLLSAPGRSVVFTRTKHGAKALTRQLSRGGVPAVELHGNLSQNARTRNLSDFHEGRVSALVATDIAARGIHVDDVTLVVHADPPAEHKAYLHRSGRTARAGASGVVVTLATPDQKREVADLMRAAKIKPSISVVATASDPVLTTIAPGERVLREYVAPAAPAPAAAAKSGSPSGGRRRRGGRPSGEAGGRSSAGRSSAGRSSRSSSGRSSSAGRTDSTPVSSGRSGRGRSGAARTSTPSRSHSASSYSSGRR